MARWGIATIVDGRVAGVSGLYRIRRLAERQARRKRAVINLDETRIMGYRVVRRSSAMSGSWGVRPEGAPEPAVPAEPDTV